jgi:hypothetical protein
MEPAGKILDRLRALLLALGAQTEPDRVGGAANR